ncbi:MAG: hypothetical protein R3C29_10445 [Dehalococcoidia bacterium]|nr:DUF402 domain-containing protein [Dehalococcoidia bacterium]MCA9844130.1 DUF402 domain-containing protein [Dehalococcoidia bacterium]
MAQDNQPKPPRGIEPPFLEKKVKIDGTVHEYRCTAAVIEPGMVVLRFPMRGGGVIPGTAVYVPPGSTSFGFFWSSKPFNLYRMVDSKGVPFAHRFDAVADVEIGSHELVYRDLVVDWWALPDETLIEEDREEYERLVAEGNIASGDADTVREASIAVFSRYRHIIERAAAVLARKQIGP